MPIQAPQWTDYLNCPACCREFAPSRSPISLGCGHTLCRLCINNLHRRQCPFDQSMILADLDELVVNTALLQLAGYTPPVQPYHPLSIKALSEQDRDAYDGIVKCLEQLAVFLKYCGNANNLIGSRLSRPMQRKLVTLLQCAVTDEEGRGKAARAARSLGDRTVTELIVQHQNPQQLSANLWAAVRSRGCQFLGPAMQEEVLKLVLLALEDGSALSRKVLVMFVVQRLEPHFPQASKTSIGHVVQLLYRASCFKVSKRVCDSSLMQLKEEFRTYDSLRREHDAQIVQIATEAGLRIAPDQWSALLYGDTKHKSHMQSIIDKLQTPQSFAQSVQELFITLQRTGDPAQLIAMSIPLDRLANIDASPDANSPTWQELSAIITSLKEVVSRLIHFMQHQNTTRDTTYNTKAIERIPDSPSHQSTVQGMPGRYKVAMCRDARTRTYCPRGNTCTYAHNEVELERYRRVISGGNYYVQPVVPQPVYQQCFSVPPPAFHKETNFKTQTMQQQASPSSRGSANCGDTMDREHNREASYEHSRERQYDVRENQYDVRETQYDVRETQYEPPSGQIYNHTRDHSYDPTREHITYHVQEHHDQAREQDHARNQLYDQAREHQGYHVQEQQYEQGREQQEYQIREPYYDPANEHLYNQARGNDHGRDHSQDAREQSYEYRGRPFEHRDPTYKQTTLNVAAKNYIPSYANAVMRGGAANKRSVNNSQHELPRENGSANTSEAPAGNYYYSYENPPYPYINTGRINNEHMAQYPIGGPTASDHNQQHHGYDQLTYMQESMPVIHYETLSYAVAVPHQMPRAQPQQESAWPTNKTIKSPPMFKIDKKAKNVPIGMEIGKTMPISLDMGMNMPIGRGMGNNMPIGRINEMNMPISSDMEKGLDIGLDMVTNMPIDVKLAHDIAVGTSIAERIAIGAQITTRNRIGTGNANNIAIGAEMKHNPIGTGLANNIAIGAELNHNPIGTNIAKNIMFGAEMAKHHPIGTTLAENIAIGEEIGKNNPMDTEIAENIAIGAQIAKNNQIETDIAENIAIGAEIAKNNPISTDIAENIAIGAQIAKNNQIDSGIAENIAIGVAIAKNNPMGTDLPKNIAIRAEIAKNNQVGTGIAENIAIGAKIAKNNPIGNDISENIATVAEIAKHNTISTDRAENIAIGDIKMPKNNLIGKKMDKNNPTDTEIANKPTAQKTNGGMMDRGSDNFMNKSKARSETQKRNDQELEVELNALEWRITTEFCMISDSTETSVDNTEEHSSVVLIRRSSNKRGKNQSS